MEPTRGLTVVDVHGGSMDDDDDDDDDDYDDGIVLSMCDSCQLQ